MSLAGADSGEMPGAPLAFITSSNFEVGGLLLGPSNPPPVCIRRDNKGRRRRSVRTMACVVVWRVPEPSLEESPTPPHAQQ